MKEKNNSTLKWMIVFVIILFGNQIFANETYGDRFNTVSYSNNDGTNNFSADWNEIEPYATNNDPTDGYIYIDNNELYFYYIWDEEISRSLDLSSIANSGKGIVLTFDLTVNNLSSDVQEIQLLDDTNSWVTVLTIDDNSAVGSFTYPLASQYIHANSAIKFIAQDNWDRSDNVRIDNLFFKLDTDSDGVPDDIDIDDDNDGILDVDEYTITETDSYAGGDSGSTHSYDYTYFSTTLVTVDFYKIDNSFNLNIDGTSILVGNKIVDLQEASTSTSSKMLFSDGGAMSQPWKENNNGTPRVRVIIDETGKVTVYATRTKSSTSYEMLHTEDGTAFNTLYFAAGTHTLTVENPDGPGPDAIKATNAVRAMDDNDNDGFINSLDLDSDNDGIPDNIEGQSTDPYNTPSGTVTAEGLWDDYGTGLIPLDTDGDDILDFLDSDSDNDGYTDCEEGNNNANANANCTNIVVGNNGMASWADSGDDYSDVNGNVNEPNPDSSGNLADEVSGNNEAAYREFLCGKALITLSHYKWRLISFPCDTGKNSIMELLGDSLGTNYGTDWEMWEQDGSDNYEVSATHKNTNKTKMNETDPIVQGKSYWIIINAGGNGNTKKVTIPKTGLTYALSPTATDDSSSIGISNTNFTKVSQFELPKASSVNVKKYMAGNPFPFSFDMTNLYFRHNSSGADYYAMGNANNDDYINNTVYKHDSNKTGPVNGYTAVVPSTPGFNAPILPMEGFFIKIETNSDTSNSNNFAYPLSMGNDK